MVVEIRKAAGSTKEEVVTGVERRMESQRGRSLSRQEHMVGNDEKPKWDLGRNKDQQDTAVQAWMHAVPLACEPGAYNQRNFFPARGVFDSILLHGMV